VCGVRVVCVVGVWCKLFHLFEQKQLLVKHLRNIRRKQTRDGTTRIAHMLNVVVECGEGK